MSDDGYTLVEMLAALVIIALAFGGLTESARTIARLQASAGHTTVEAAGRAATERALRAALDDQGPFLSTGRGDFSGDTSGFSFACGTAVRCGAKLEPGPTNPVLVAFRGTDVVARVSANATLAFRYADSEQAAGSWPISALPDRTLRAVSLVGPDHAPIATVRLAIEEPWPCIFDVVSGVCRVAS